jgi:pimeloyl-ACP methyl ester carboxylesterase
VTAARTAEQTVRANGIDLCLETFGHPGDPAILLIMGAGGSMLAWHEAFCKQLAAGSRFVIRYDNRDTGRSVTYPPGAPQYTGADLVADTAALLDALGIEGAHLVGMSMGGAIAQLAALQYPERVDSLTLISTSAGPGDPDLPGMADRLRARFAAPPPTPDWSDREAVIEYIIEEARAYAATTRPFDEAAWREVAGRDFDRSVDIASSMTNHMLADATERWRERLGALSAPTLIIHGDEDPLFPLAHAHALKSEIPNARLLVLEQTGHELPRRVWDAVVPAILAHTQRG